VQELQNYSDIDGTETGDTCGYLCQLVSCTPYLSEEFNAALIQEIQDQLDNFKDNAVIVEEVETIKQTSRRLEWNE
jgi:hypothetical protein